MYQEFYRNSDLLHLPLFTLCFFIAVFLGVVAWVFVVERRNDHFDRMAQLPLAGENVGGNDE